MTRLGAGGKYSAVLSVKMTRIPEVWVVYPDFFRVCMLLGQENGRFGL
jgi:hypothetical protein